MKNDEDDDDEDIIISQESEPPLGVQLAKLPKVFKTPPSQKSTLSEQGYKLFSSTHRYDVKIVFLTLNNSV